MVLDLTSVQTIVSGSNHPFILIFRIYRVYRKTVALQKSLANLIPIKEQIWEFLWGK